MLDSDQIAHFKQHGYVILRGFIEDDTLQAWRDQFWGHVGAESDDPSTWPEDYVVKDFGGDPVFGGLPQMQSSVGQLGGESFQSFELRAHRGSAPAPIRQPHLVRALAKRVARWLLFSPI